MDVRNILQQMLQRGWQPGAPGSPSAVEQIERDFDVTLPADYRDFLLIAGGGESVAPEAYTGLWTATGVVTLNRRYRIPWNFPGLVGIGNDGFLVYVIDFRTSPVIASLGLSSSLWDDVVTECDTFCEWLERRIP